MISLNNYHSVFDLPFATVLAPAKKTLNSLIHLISQYNVGPRLMLYAPT